MNRPLWLSFLLVTSVFILPPVLLAGYLTKLAARHFDLGTGAHVLVYAALSFILVVVWPSVFVLHARFSKRTNDTPSKHRPHQ